MKLFHKFLAVLLFFFLALTAGCGGKYEPVNSFNADSFNKALQGIFSGTTAGNASQNILVPGGYYEIYGASSGGGISIRGVRVGAGAITTDGFTITYTNYPTAGGVLPGSLLLTPSDNAINGTLLEVGNLYSLSASRLPTANYEYNAFASQSFVSGNWTGTFFDGSSASLNISITDGKVTGSTGTCTFTGTVTPDTSGHNFYNAKITFGVAPCANPGSVASGIAIAGFTTSGQEQLIIVGSQVLSSTQTSGFLFISTR